MRPCRRLLLLQSRLFSSTDNLVLYDTRTGIKCPVKPRIPGILTWYMCGPTVYADSHIGHAGTYIRFDVIRRILQGLFNYRIITAMCITDIDDKIINASNKANVNYSQLARNYEQSFFSDLDRLNVLRPSLTLRVTEHMPQIIDFIQKTIDNKFAYVANDGSVYFDVSSYGSRYSVFTKIHSAVPDAVLAEGKRSSADFALWKSAKPKEPSWSVSWRVEGGKPVVSRGRPGWHIECSTLSTLVFGNWVDFHSGGEDLIFPHHQNEIAQCVGAGCVDSPAAWVGHWLHTGHLHVPSSRSDAKMSKSLGNTISIPQMLDGSGAVEGIKSISSAEYRTFSCLSHYRERLVCSVSRLNEAKRVWRKIEEFANIMRAWASDHYQICIGPDQPLSEADLYEKLMSFRSEYMSKLADDIDTPGAFDVLDSTMRDMNRLVSQQSNYQPAFNDGSVVVSPAIPLAFLDGLSEFTSLMGLPNPDPASSVQLQAVNMPSTSEGDDINLDEVLEVAVQFRSFVRKFLLENRSTSTDKRLMSSILKICDEFRSKLVDLGIDVKDTGIGRATWKKR